MKLKFFQIRELNNLYPKLKDAKLPLKTSYQLSLAFDEIEKRMAFYQNEFQKIIDEFAERDEAGDYVPSDDGAGVKVQKGKTDECNARVIELNQIDIDIPDLNLSIEDFGDLDLTLDEVRVLSLIL